MDFPHGKVHHGSINMAPRTPPPRMDRLSRPMISVGTHRCCDLRPRARSLATSTRLQNSRPTAFDAGVGRP